MCSANKISIRQSADTNAECFLSDAPSLGVRGSLKVLHFVTQQGIEVVPHFPRQIVRLRTGEKVG